MGKEKRISVVMPVYNTAPYLKRCIGSILEQTYKNMEIICVDDGSTDQSGQILDDFMERDARVKVIHKSNEGVSAARNTALIAATGDYIGFIDSDDYVAPDYYEKLADALKNETVDIATCGYYFDYNGEIVKANNKKCVPIEPMDIIRFFPYMYERDIYKGVGGYLWTKLIRREVIKNSDGTLKVYFRKEYGGADDIAFVAEMSMACRAIQYINEPLYYYFQREGSIVHSNIAQLRTLDWAEAYEWIIGRYQDFGIQEDNLDIIKRMYVYRCGKLLETAVELQDAEKIHILQGKIKRELLSYVKTNMEHLDRVQWILKLLLYKTR